MRTLSKIQITLLALAIMVAIPFSAYAADGKIQIGQTSGTTFPITISQSGSYILTSDLTVSTDVNCIVIEADNVTLDLNGFALIGSRATSSSASGISSSDRKNITVKNGTVRDFSYNGIYFFASGVTYQNNQLKDIKVFNNENGIRATGTNITNCSATWNDERGFWVIFGSTLTDCVANQNGTEGIYTRNSTITNCTANGNGNNGIDADNSQVTDCVANQNGGDGIFAYQSIITNCLCTESGYNGILASGASTITNCTVLSNTLSGIVAYQSIITNCTCLRNTTNGIVAHSSTITNCIATDNSRNGIALEDSNRVEGNNLTGNTDYGIYIKALQEHNYIIKNTGSYNGAGNFYSAGGPNNHMPLTGDNANVGW